MKSREFLGLSLVCALLPGLSIWLVQPPPPCQAFHLQNTALYTVQIFLTNGLFSHARQTSERESQSSQSSERSGSTLSAACLCSHFGRRTESPHSLQAAEAWRESPHLGTPPVPAEDRRKQQNQLRVLRWTVNKAAWKGRSYLR